MTNGIVWTPPIELKVSSNLTSFMRAHAVPDYETLLQRSHAEPEWFWNAVLERIRFSEPYERVFDDSKGAAFTRWCIGGKTNVVANCLDQHAGTDTWDKDLLIWEGEDGKVERYSYRRMNAAVSRLAEGMRLLGIRPGEVVAIYLPNVPEAFIAFYAIAKIGAIILPMFSGFGPEALADRLRHSGAAAIITADANLRRGSLVPMKANVDEAAVSTPDLRHVITVGRHGVSTAGWERDVDYQALVSRMPDRSQTEVMDADAPMMIMYTSGTTGRPKGTVHTHCGFTAKMALDLGLLLDFKPSDRMLWISDMGWLVGPIAAVASALHGGTYVMVEGGPDYPDPGRMWRLIAQHKVSFLGVAPTTIRSLMKAGREEVSRHDLSSIRIAVSTGEVWTPDAWTWTFEQVCGRKAPILNWSGGTEVGGGILAGTVLHPMKPCAFTAAIPGMHADIVNDKGVSVGRGEVGELVLRGPSIGLSQGLWKDDDRYVESYWRQIPGVWRQGDWATIDTDGFWFLLGRSDDTLKIAGKRTGPSEVENCLASTGKIAEASVIGVPDAVKGQAIWCVVTLLAGVAADRAVEKQLSEAVVSKLGVPYRPQAILFVPDLPKTRNMKIMRRVVRAACLGENPGDLSALVNPEAVDAIRQAAALKAVEMSKSLSQR